MSGQGEGDRGRRRYRAPQIERIGSVAEITAAGSGGSTDSYGGYQGEGSGSGFHSPGGS